MATPRTTIDEEGLADMTRGHRVHVGSQVRVRDADGEDEYTIVRRGAADATHGRISADSPVGRAVLGRLPGEEVEVRTPGGIRLLTIVAIVPEGAAQPHLP